jgi:hypothetical protein
MKISSENFEARWKKKKKNRISKNACVYALLLISFCTPVPHLPLLFQGVSASSLPTKSLSLTPIKDPGTNFFVELRTLHFLSPEIKKIDLGLNQWSSMNPPRKIPTTRMATARKRV